MRLLYRFILPSLLFVSISTYSQDLARVKSYLDTLCSPNYYGRGAAFDGQKKAAVFLEKKFREIGLLPIGKSYLQPFNYDINTFPGKLSVTIDKNKPTPGIDYIINASSPSLKSSYRIFKIDSSLLTNPSKIKQFHKTDFSKSIPVMDEQVAKEIRKKLPQLSAKLNQAPCIVELKDKKLTMGLSTNQNNSVVIEYLKSKFPANARNLSIELEASLIKKYEAQNIVGVVPGTESPDSFIVVTAHYDHLGTLGKNTYFPGANDNGSGISMLLELAAHTVKNPLRYSIVFIAFGGEEAGLIGSKFFTENPLIPLQNIRFLVNIDLMGTGDDGIMVVNGTVHEKEFNLVQEINTQETLLKEVKKRGRASNSDHYYFSEKGVPAFFFYTLGGISAYHDVYDVPETLPLTKFSEVFQLLLSFMTTLSK